MAIRYKVIERGTPGVAGGGEKKYYASANVTGETSLEGITKIIEKISTVSGADIRAVLYAMVDAMENNLAEGKVVRLGELGSLRVSLSSEGKATEDEVNAAAIRNSKVIFTPGKKIKDMLTNLEYKKV